MLRLLALACVLIACQTLPAKAEPVSFDLVDRNSIDLSRFRSADFLGFPIVVEFYFNGCPACESNAAAVRALAEDWHGDRAQVVEIGIDCEESDYADWIERHASIGPVLDNCTRELARSLGVTAYPTTVVLDASHEIAYRTVGVWSSVTAARIRQTLEQSHAGSGTR